MQNSIKKPTNLLIILTIILSGLLASVTHVFSGILSLGLAASFLFATLYFIFIRKTFWVFLAIIPFLPPYFAIKLAESMPVITAFRAVLLFWIVDQLIIKKRVLLLLRVIKEDRFTSIIFIYSFGMLIPGIVLFITEKNTTALVGSISILIEKILLYYLVVMNVKLHMQKHGSENTLDKFTKVICLSAFVLSVLGIVEFLISYNIFTLLETSNVAGLVSSTYIRQGELRVSTSFSHALGYGLYLLLVIPIAYYKMKKHSNKKDIRYLFYILLIFLLLLNVLLTTSRSVLLALGFAFLVFFLRMSLKRKIIIFYVSLFIGIPTLALSLTTYSEDIPIISVIGQNTKGLSDTLLGTQFVQDYGDNEEPFTFRNALITYALHQPGVEGAFGKGIGFIRTEPLIFYLPELNPYGPIEAISIDNYYINSKIESGWVGFTVTVLFFLTILRSIFKNRKKNLFYTVLLVSFMGYLVELTMVNELETIKFFFILLAVYSATLTIKKQKQQIS